MTSGNALLLTKEMVLARLKQLPSLPSAVSSLLSSFDNPDVDIDVIARQIARDQGLSARVLRVANSSFYGRQSRVATIQEAVVVLGFKAVRSTVLSVGMSGAFRADQCPGFDAQAYLRHGVGTALSARVLASLVRLDPEQAFTAGLLHDIGQMVLASNFPVQYAQVIARRRTEDCLLIEAERSVLGLDHAEVGGWLADAWRFPQQLQEGVRAHHQPSVCAVPGTNVASFADLIHLADITAHALGLSGSPEECVPPLDAAAWARLAISPDAYGEALGKITAGMDEACQVFGT